MTIVDSKKRKDFYDFVHHEPDPIPYYDRKNNLIWMNNKKTDEYNSETSFLNVFQSTFHLHWGGFSTIRKPINQPGEKQYQILCIGDKTYLIFKQSTGKDGLKIMYCRDVDTLDYGKDNRIQTLLKSTDFVKVIKEINQKNKIPVSLWTIGREQTEIEVNPSLIPYASYLKPEQVYQEIEMWLSNYNKDPNIETVGGDEVILQQKGFDKKSFRKGKEAIETKWVGPHSQK